MKRKTKYPVYASEDNSVRISVISESCSEGWAAFIKVTKAPKEGFKLGSHILLTGNYYHAVPYSSLKKVS